MAYASIHSICDETDINNAINPGDANDEVGLTDTRSSSLPTVDRHPMTGVKSENDEPESDVCVPLKGVVECISILARRHEVSVRRDGRASASAA